LRKSASGKKASLTTEASDRRGSSDARPVLEAGLNEVTVEGEGAREIAPAHDRKAGAIGERPLLVVLGLEHLPRGRPYTLYGR
jgi:hypothetical protein